MKKFVVLGVAVCAAVASQAASFTWANFNAINDGSGVYTGGGTAYLIDGADGHGGISQSALFDQIKGGAAIAWNNYTFYSATLDNDGKSFTAGATTWGELPVVSQSVQIAQPYAMVKYTKMGPSGQTEDWKTYDSTPGDPYLNSGDFYSVLVADDGKYYFSEVYELNITGQGTVDIKFDNLAKGAFVANDGGWYTAVPEPTSGLLMLVGLSLLGLRRKPRA